MSRGASSLGDLDVALGNEEGEAAGVDLEAEWGRQVECLTVDAGERVARA